MGGAGKGHGQKFQLFASIEWQWKNEWECSAAKPQVADYSMEPDDSKRGRKREQLELLTIGGREKVENPSATSSQT